MIILKNFAEDIIKTALKLTDSFNSDYEALAYMWREMQELEREVNALRRNIQCAWSSIGREDHEASVEYIDKARKHAKLAIAECGQLGAMCEKYKER